MRLLMLAALVGLALVVGADVARAAPVTVSTQPADGATVTTARPLISASFSDPLMYIYGSPSAWMKVDGRSVTPSVTMGVVGSTYTALLSYVPRADLAPGPHTAQASVMNLAGERATVSWSFSVILPPVLGSVQPPPDATVSTDQPTISATVSQGAVGITGTCLVDGITAPLVIDATGTQVTALLAGPLANDRTHDVTMTVTNAYGLSTTRSWSFYVQIYSPMQVVSDCGACHPAQPLTHDMTLCDGCHGPGSPLGGDYQGSPHPADWLVVFSCYGCHDAGTYSSLPPLHPFTPDPYHASAACSPCHVRSLSVEHNRRTDASGANLTCLTCHQSADPRVTDAITSRDTSCAACHTIPDGHGTGSADHVATVAASIDPSGLSCGSCHQMDLPVEHARPSASSMFASCANCHPAPRDSVGAWERGCAQGACHAPASPTEQHAAAATKHALPPAADSCVTAACHPGADLAGLHTSAVATVDGASRTGCLVCHSASSMPATSDCTTCHQDRTQPHGYNPATHTASPAPSGIVIGTTTYGPLPCADCHTLELSPEHAKPTSSSAVGGCATCHPSPRGSFSTWDKATCAQGDCHTSGSPKPQHAGAGPAHARLDRDSSCSGSSCHGDGDLASLHTGATVVVGGASRSSCAVCHTAGVPTSRDCATCHPDKAPGNHGTATAHTFSATSDYANAAQTGCTNSGIGCHGIETAYADFTAYHPASACSTGACHTSPSKATYTGTGECADCHDGTFSGAPDVIGLVAPTPNGHYGATPHAPNGLTGVVSAGGTARATCADCHDPAESTGLTGLYAQHQGLPSPSGATTCADCHNADTLVASIVKNGWTARTCDACHTDSVLSGMVQHGDTAPAVAGQPVGSYNGGTCSGGGCHATTDLHLLHKDAPTGCATAGCHDYAKQAAKPTGVSCGPGGACHSGDEPHPSLATAHDASAQPLAQPGSTLATVNSTAESQSFPTTTWPADWSRSTTQYIRAQTTRAHGTAAAECYATSSTRRTSSFYKDVNLSGYETASLSFWQATAGFAGGSDYARVEYSTNGGSTWAQLSNQTTSSGWALRTYSLPAGGTVRIRFTGSVNSTSEFCDWDDVAVAGTTRGMQPLPAGSTAAVACQNNPNGAECHAVSDVAALHDAAGVRCSTCHGSTAPTKDCQTSGCHATQYVNRDDHDNNRHATAFASGASGAVFAGTGFQPTWCAGCHDDGVDDEHEVLDSYSATPCSICHDKQADSGAPTNVTAADVTTALAKPTGTALCTDCHRTVTAQSIHVQRAGAGAGRVQFDPAWSGHRAYDTMVGSKTDFGVVNGVAVSNWALPAVANWLSTGWQNTTIAVRCNDCHGAVSGTTAPHAGRVTINIASGYSNSYSSGSAYLSSSGVQGNPICVKCHQAGNSMVSANNVHSRSNHQGTTNGRCINCHSKTPHAWRLPRSLGYRADPPAYQSNNINAFTARNHTPDRWDKGYCGTNGCHSNTASSPTWP